MSWKTFCVYVWGFFWYIYIYLFHQDKLDDYEKMKELLDTPKKVQAFLDNNIDYEEDPKNIWKSSLQTFKDEKGDCEDQGILGIDFLKDDYNPKYLKLMCMYRIDSRGEGHGHATALIKEFDRWITIGTFGYQEHPTDYKKAVENFKNYDNWIQIDIYNSDLVIEKHIFG